MPVDPQEAEISHTEPDFTPIEEGVYQFEIVDVNLIKDVRTEYKGNVKYKNYLYFYCVILDEAFRNEVILYKVTDSYNAAFDGGSPSKLYELACAAYQKILDPEKEPVDVNELVGAVFTGKVVNSTSNNRTYHNIKKTIQANGDVNKLSEKEIEEALEVVKKIHTKVEQSVETGDSDTEDQGPEDEVDEQSDEQDAGPPPQEGEEIPL